MKHYRRYEPAAQSNDELLKLCSPLTLLNDEKTWQKKVYKWSAETDQNQPQTTTTANITSTHQPNAT